jgi:hypothetical protein
MSAWMTSEQRYFWMIQLELKLRRASGVGFQDFFSDVMERLHRDDFIRTRPYGQMGDRGCDGYLASAGQLFACYGKVGDAAPSVPTLIEKMDDDYGKACTHLHQVMKEWHFVHNLLDGTATDATVKKIEDMKAVHTAHKFGVVGHKGIEDRVFKLPEHDILALIGPAVSAEDTRNLRLEIVAQLINGVMTAVETAPMEETAPLKPVPFGKLEFNALPMHWRHAIKAAMPNTEHVADYFGSHVDTERGIKVAATFKARYKTLDAQGLAPGAIMTALYDDIVGVGVVPNERAVAAHALLAYLFEACDIFKDKPVEVAA